MNPTVFRLRRPQPPESAIQAAILKALFLHPAVAAAWRQNTGAMSVGEGKARRFVRFGPPGSPDIHGFLKDGRALFVEVKRPSARVTPEQQAFIDKALAAGCCAMVARSVDEVWRALDRQTGG